MSLSFRLSVSLSIHPSLCRYEAVWPRIYHFHVFMDFVSKYLIGLLGKGWYDGADWIDLTKDRERQALVKREMNI